MHARVQVESESVAPQDPELIERLAAGDRGALAELFDLHGAAVLRLARAIVADRSTAEDVVQETFTAALTHAVQFRGEGSVRGWLFALARHAAFRTRRALEVSAAPDSPLLELGVAAGWGAEDALDQLVRAEDVRRVAAALRRLPAPERELLTLRDLEGLSGEETARVLGLSVAAMKSRLHRARLRLLALLREMER